MLLQRVIVALVMAVPIAMFSLNVSFDFENYVSYAFDPEAALERFRAEPIFPLFVLSGQLLGFAPAVTIRVFVFVAAFMLTYAVVILACEDRRWSLTRAGLTVAISLPFILFALIVPRQGFATGPVLMAFLTVRRDGRLMTWRTLILLSVSLMAHTPTAAFGVALIFFGHTKMRHVLIILPISITLLMVVAFVGPELFNHEDTRYAHYLTNFRDTGRFRMAFFALVAFSYLVLSSRQTGGFLGVTPARSLLVVFLFSAMCIAAYAYFSKDAVRITYSIGIMMIIEMSRRFVFARRTRPDSACRSTSKVRTHSQNMTTAARAQAERNTFGHLS